MARGEERRRRPPPALCGSPLDRTWHSARTPPRESKIRLMAARAPVAGAGASPTRARRGSGLAGRVSPLSSLLHPTRVQPVSSPASDPLSAARDSTPPSASSLVFSSPTRASRVPLQFVSLTSTLRPRPLTASLPQLSSRTDGCRSPSSVHGAHPNAFLSFLAQSVAFLPLAAPQLASPQRRQVASWPPSASSVLPLLSMNPCAMGPPKREGCGLR